MNFNGFSGNNFKAPSDKKKPYIAKITLQLSGVLVIVLLLMLFKYTNSNGDNSINTSIKNNFYKDYSSNVNYMVKKYSPEVKDAVETFVRNVENQ